MGTARLEVVAGKARGTSIYVEDELLIGRLAEGAGRLADDDEISRSHARVNLDGSGFCAVEDLGSTNGTFVNGLRISGPQTLSEGDTIELGGTTLVVRELPPLKDAHRAPPVGQDTIVPGAGVGDAAVPTPLPAERPSPAPEQSGEAVPSQPTSVARGAAASEVGPPPPEPAGAAASRPEAAIISLHLEIDPAGPEVRISVDEGTEPLRLVFESGAWRTRTPDDAPGPARRR